MNAITKITTPRPGLISAAEAARPRRGAAGSARRGEADRQQQVRDRQQHVDGARDRACRSSRGSSRRGARRPRRAIVASAVADEGDDQRDPGAVDRAAEDVAADLSTPKQCSALGPVGGARRPGRARSVSRHVGPGAPNEADHDRRRRSRPGSAGRRRRAPRAPAGPRGSAARTAATAIAPPARRRRVRPAPLTPRPPLRRSSRNSPASNGSRPPVLSRKPPPPGGGERLDPSRGWPIASHRPRAEP